MQTINLFLYIIGNEFLASEIPLSNRGFLLMPAFLLLLLNSGLPLTFGQPRINSSQIDVEVVFQGLDFPTSMEIVGPDDILVLEKENGTVQRIVDGRLSSKPLLDVPVASKGERGMLGIAVANTEIRGDGVKYVYLFYTESATGRDGDDGSQGLQPGGNRVYRFEMDNDNIKNGKMLLNLPSSAPRNVTPFHNGGQLLIGPNQSVFAVIGDLNHRRTQAQNIPEGPSPDGTSIIYRIDHNGHPVEGNPFEGPHEKYFAYGVRNSFGMDIDPLTGNLWNTENGPNYGDEINLVEPGFNSGGLYIFGMSSAKQRFSPDKLVDFGGKGKYSDPEFSWDLPVGVTALKFFNSDKYGKEYMNDILVGDVNNGNIYRFELNEDRTELLLHGGLRDKIAQELNDTAQIVFATGFGGITDMDIGPDGYLYVLTINRFHEDNSGTIYRLIPA